MARSQRHAIRCPTCAGSALRPGLLWLGGDSWLTCPDCNGTQRVQMVEERYSPKERTVLVPGCKAHVERKLYVPPYKGCQRMYG